MTARFLAATLGMMTVLGLAGVGSAQDRPKSAPSQSKGKTAASDAKAAEKEKALAKTEKATLGGGCFWCLEAFFERIPGVKSVVSGYAGGNVPNPSYDMVCSGLTGHAEVVQIEYDPEVISFDKLLKIFWACHDPTTPNRQGPDVGTQYRSIILYQNDDQKKAALDMYRALTTARAFRAPIVTELVPLSAFYPAEDYHQDYYRKHRNADYCRIYIDPKLRKLLPKLKAAGTPHPQTKSEGSARPKS
jgi:peptide-methionine (S)-S-oxide reductase